MGNMCRRAQMEKATHTELEAGYLPGRVQGRASIVSANKYLPYRIVGRMKSAFIKYYFDY